MFKRHATPEEQEKIDQANFLLKEAGFNLVITELQSTESGGGAVVPTKGW